MNKILSTSFAFLLMCGSFAMTNVAEARLFTCMVCNKVLDVRLDVKQKIDFCIDGYMHFLSPNGGIGFTLVPRHDFERHIKNLQGTWCDNNNNKNVISIQGKYLNGCAIRSMVDFDGNSETYFCKVILQEKDTRSAEFGANLSARRPFIVFDGKYYYRK